jgi:hypothetical protein
LIYGSKVVRSAAAQQVGRLVWSVAWFGRSVTWSDGSLVGRSVGRLVGWSLGRLSAAQLNRTSRSSFDQHIAQSTITLSAPHLHVHPSRSLLQPIAPSAHCSTSQSHVEVIAGPADRSINNLYFC